MDSRELGRGCWFYRSFIYTYICIYLALSQGGETGGATAPPLYSMALPMCITWLIESVTNANHDVVHTLKVDEVIVVLRCARIIPRADSTSNLTGTSLLRGNSAS